MQSLQMKEWLHASLYVAYCDGDFAPIEEEMIVSISRRWFAISDDKARKALRQARYDFHTWVREASRRNQQLIDILFPQGIQSKRKPIRTFLVGLITVKMADKFIDERERDALLDIIALMPSNQIPPFEDMRLEAKELFRLHAVLLGLDHKV